MHRHTGSGGTPREAAPLEPGPLLHARRSWLQRAGLLALGALSAPWLSACQPVPPAPLKVGISTWVGHDPLILARERGLIDSRMVKVIELSSSSETLRNYRNRLLDAAALTLDEVLRLADEGFEPRIVAVLSASAGADVVMARPEVRDLDDLRGRRLAVEATTVGALMLQRLLGAARLTPSDVQVLNVEATQHAELLRNGRVDLSVTYEPLASQLKADGFRPIFDSRQMLGDILDVLVVDEQTLRERPQQVRGLVLGWQRGLRVARQEPEQSAQLLTTGVDMTPQEYLVVSRGLQFYSPAQSLQWISGRPPPLGQASDGLALTLLSLGLIRDTPDWGRLLAPEPAQQLQADLEAGV